MDQVLDMKEGEMKQEMQMQQELKKKHTPTPWRMHWWSSIADGEKLFALNRVGRHPLGRNWGATVVAADGETVLDTYGYTYEEATEIAERALRAVNSQEALIEALRHAINQVTLAADQLDTWARQSREGGWSTHQVDPMRAKADSLRREASAIRAALSAAQEQSQT